MVLTSPNTSTSSALNRPLALVCCAAALVLLTLGSGIAWEPKVGEVPVLASHSPVVAAVMTRPCAGHCPVYELRVHADGVVDYCGEKHVKVAGVQRAKLTSSQLDALTRAFDEAAFTTRKRTYSSPVSACGTATKYIRGGLKTIAVTGVPRKGDGSAPEYIKGPAALDILQQQIAEVVDLEQWTGTALERMTGSTNSAECGIVERTRFRARQSLWSMSAPITR